MQELSKKMKEECKPSLESAWLLCRSALGLRASCWCRLVAAAYTAWAACSSARPADLAMVTGRLLVPLRGPHAGRAPLVLQVVAVGSRATAALSPALLATRCWRAPRATERLPPFASPARTKNRRKKRKNKSQIRILNPKLLLQNLADSSETQAIDA